MCGGVWRPLSHVTRLNAHTPRHTVYYKRQEWRARSPWRVTGGVTWVPNDPLREEEEEEEGLSHTTQSLQDRPGSSHPMHYCDTDSDAVKVIHQVLFTFLVTLMKENYDTSVTKSRWTSPTKAQGINMNTFL